MCGNHEFKEEMLKWNILLLSCEFVRNKQEERSLKKSFIALKDETDVFFISLIVNKTAVR